MDREAQQVIVHGVASRSWLGDYTTTSVEIILSNTLAGMTLYITGHSLSPAEILCTPVCEILNNQMDFHITGGNYS